MTTVATHQNILLGQGKTTKISAHDLVKELKTIRHVLEKVEKTNGDVLKQIQIRAKERSVHEDTSPKIADMRAKAKQMRESMDAGDQRLNELGKTVNAVCCKVDDVINKIHETDKADEQENVGQRSLTARSKGIEKNGKTRDGKVDIRSNVEVKRSSTKQPEPVQKLKDHDRKTKSRTGQELPTDPALGNLPAIVCTSGFKRRITQESSDNRHKTDKLAQQKQMELQRTNVSGAKSDLEPAYVNIKNISVRLKEQEARFDTDFKDMPGLSSDTLGGQGNDTMLADLVWQQWHSYAESEKNKAGHRHIVRTKGPDVVLCLDISQSMEGAAFEEMMSFAMKYVEGVEQVASALDLKENISITTFGFVTKVWLHLTSDYKAVKDTLREIGSLIPRGRSPIAGGLLVALAGCLGNSDPIVVGTVPILARIILVSDGKGTPDHIKNGPELMRTQEEDMRSSLRVEGTIQHVSKNLKKRKNMVCCVPVGNANTKPLEEISKITGGKVIGPLQRNRLVKWSQLTVRAADLCRKTAELTDGKNPEQFESVVRLFMGMDLISEPEEDKEDVLRIATHLIRGSEETSDEHMTLEHDPDLPPLGTRVRRGPGWHYPDHQDSNGPGTVCCHGRSGMVWVEWDNSHRNCYNYKGGAHEVVTVTEKRVLKKDEIIAPGCYVKRGDNWSNGDEDGGPGTMGVVTRVHHYGTVIVRWPNKIFKEYKFGSEGLFEVQVCTDDSRPSVHTEENQPGSHTAPAAEGLRIESFLPPPK